MSNFRIRGAGIVGREHMLRQENFQDAYAYERKKISKKEYFFGVVCDGCGEGLNSEVGSKLAANFIVKEISRLLSAGVWIRVIPGILYLNILNFLNGIVGSIPKESDQEKVDFVHNYLSFTIVGFVMDRQQGLIFTSGDGLIFVEDGLGKDLIEINQNNMPEYIGYHLIDKKYLSSNKKLSERFNLYLFNPQSLCRLAIATDGFEHKLIENVWGSKHPRRLQRKLNVWSKQKHFADDASIVIVESF